MKRLAIVVLIAVILGGISVLLSRESTVEYIQQKEVIEVDALDKAIKEAQEAKKVDIENTAQAAWQSAYDQEMKKVELEVLRSFSDKLDTRQIELEKETKSY